MRATIDRTYFSAACRRKVDVGRDAQHEPQAVGRDEADAVNLVGQPVRVFADQPDRIVAIRLAHAPRVGFAQADVAQPGVDVRDAWPPWRTSRGSHAPDSE